MKVKGRLDISVLYVEDEDSAREEVLEFLKGRIREVLEADSGAEGLEIFRQRRPDVVITDLRMPEMDGIEMARAIREVDRNAPIVVVSAHSDSSYLLDAIEADVDQYVLKPISLKKLLAVVEKIAGIIDNRNAAKKYNEERERLIRELEALNERLARLATTDSLTRIANRMKFHDALAVEIGRSRRFNNSLSLIMFDIDHFKGINDTYGHRAGDCVLQELAELVKKQVRSHDLFARWGGEEFIILATQTGLEGARSFADKLRCQIQERKFSGGARVTCSFGVTEFKSSDNEDLFVWRADKASYEAKACGRNCVESI